CPPAGHRKSGYLGHGCLRVFDSGESNVHGKTLHEPHHEHPALPEMGRLSERTAAEDTHRLGTERSHHSTTCCRIREVGCAGSPPPLFRRRPLRARRVRRSDSERNRRNVLRTSESRVRETKLSFDTFVGPPVPVVTSDLPPGQSSRAWSAIASTLI